MHLHLKTKITLIIAVLVLAVVGVNSWLYLATLTKQVIRQADNRADLVAQQIFFQAQNALADAAHQRPAPAPDDLADLREYVRSALEQNAALTLADRCRSRLLVPGLRSHDRRSRRYRADLQRHFTARTQGHGAAAARRTS